VRLVAASTQSAASVGPASEQVELSASPCRLAASPTRLSALADGALRSRHETSGSGAPALLSAAASTTRSRLESGAPALGQAARSRQRRRRCSTSSRCLRAAAAQLTSSATTRLVRSPPRICGTRLAWWTSPLCVQWVVVLVGWVTARKEMDKSSAGFPLPRIWGSEWVTIFEVFVPSFAYRVLALFPLPPPALEMKGHKIIKLYKPLAIIRKDTVEGLKPPAWSGGATNSNPSPNPNPNQLPAPLENSCRRCGRRMTREGGGPPAGPPWPRQPLRRGA
jgi:hypothetical protein